MASFENQHLLGLDTVFSRVAMLYLPDDHE
jgi:hypothetical protein